MGIFDSLKFDKLLNQEADKIIEELRQAREYKKWLDGTKKEKSSDVAKNYKELGENIFRAFSYAKQCYLKHKDRI